MMMAEAPHGDDDIFVYIGGEQQVPERVRRARIHKSVKIVRARAFYNRQNLIYVEFHDEIEIIEEEAFYNCQCLRGPIKLLGVRIIKEKAFYNCGCRTGVEFGDKLETIEELAFHFCASLENIKMTSVRTIGEGAFYYCWYLSDVECGEALRTLQGNAFYGCQKLKRIALPLKGDIVEDCVFDGCSKLERVDLVGGIHKTVASLHMENWRNEMNIEINRINQVLPTIREGKTAAIQLWMRTVSNRLDHYKGEHLNMLKEATTLLELVLWKANLDYNKGDRTEREGVRLTRSRRKRARKEISVTSGADVVIKNVLPFLALK